MQSNRPGKLRIYGGPWVRHGYATVSVRLLQCSNGPSQLVDKKAMIDERDECKKVARFWRRCWHFRRDICLSKHDFFHRFILFFFYCTFFFVFCWSAKLIFHLTWTVNCARLTLPLETTTNHLMVLLDSFFFSTLTPLLHLRKKTLKCVKFFYWF